MYTKIIFFVLDNQAKRGKL